MEKDSPSIQTGIYHHYKGKDYDVLGIGHHSETLDPLVFYRGLYFSFEFGANPLWARPLALFTDHVTIDGQTISRFSYQGSPIPNVQKTRGCAVFFVNQKEEFLFRLRDDIPSIPSPNQWDLIGGHVELDEDPITCLQRETKEEIGLDILPPALFSTLELVDHFEYTYWMKKEINLKAITLTEGQRLEWLPYDEAIKLPLAWDLLPRLKALYRDKPYAKSE